MYHLQVCWALPLVPASPPWSALLPTHSRHQPTCGVTDHHARRSAHVSLRPRRPGRRENTTAQYLSWKTAVTYGCWATSPQKQAADPSCAERVTELGNDWPQFQIQVDEWYAKSEASCRAAGKPVTFLSMEDYLAPRWQTYEQEVAKLAHSQGIAMHPV